MAMRLAVWWVRLVYVAWMVPAGLNHFIRLYPQPGGANPLSDGVFTALLDSGLFTLVKAVELLAGLMLLFGIRVPLALVMVLPVSFTVWYWDTELQGWWSVSAVYGWAILSCNLFLLYAYRDQFRGMWESYALPRMPWMKPYGERTEGAMPLTMLQLALGLIMVPTALAYFLPDLLPFVRVATWEAPMSVRLMGYLDASGLLAVAKFIQLVGGLALLLNRAVPFALAAMVCVNVCGAFVAVLIEGEPFLATMALGVLALNVLLMFAYLPAYSGVLASGAIADGEAEEPGNRYESLFINPLAGASRRGLIIGTIALLGALAFYWRVVPFANGPAGLAVLVFPAAVLLANLVRAKN